MGTPIWVHNVIILGWAITATLITLNVWFWIMYWVKWRRVHQQLRNFGAWMKCSNGRLTADAIMAMMNRRFVFAGHAWFFLSLFEPTCIQDEFEADLIQAGKSFYDGDDKITGNFGAYVKK